MKKVIAVLFFAVLLTTSTSFAMDDGLKRIIDEHDFKDPGSVMVRKVMTSSNERGKYWCGEVNAKNAFGAYTGYQRFWAMQSDKGGQMQVGNVDILCQAVKIK